MDALQFLEFLSVELIAFADALMFVVVPNAVSVYAWQQGASKLSLLSENDLVPKYKIKWSAKKMRISPKWKTDADVKQPNKQSEKIECPL